MVDIHALNMLLWSVTIVCVVAIGVAAVAVILTWLASRRRYLRHVASGIRAAEAHLAGQPGTTTSASTGHERGGDPTGQALWSYVEPL